MFALATDSTFFWKQGGRGNVSHTNMAERVAHALTLQGKTFDMRSADLMAINGGDVSQWTSAAHSVARIPGLG